MSIRVCVGEEKCGLVCGGLKLRVKVWRMVRCDALNKVRSRVDVEVERGSSQPMLGGI